MSKYKKAVLYSGGLDSCCSLYEAAKTVTTGSSLLAIFINYGQAALEPELHYSRLFIKEINKIFDIRVDLHIINYQDLYKNPIERYSLDKPKILYQFPDKVSNNTLPYRNLMFSLQAMTVCEMLGIEELYVGYGYLKESEQTSWDSCYAFVDFINNIVSGSESIINLPGMTDSALALGKCKVISPMYKQERLTYIRNIKNLGIPIEISWSCYRGSDLHCGECWSCDNRKAVGNINTVYLNKND